MANDTQKHSENRHFVYEDGRPCCEAMGTRRIDVTQLSPAETAIRSAMIAVEEMPADTRLTEATIHLQRARDKVADYIDHDTTTLCIHGDAESHGLCPAIVCRLSANRSQRELST